MESVEEDKQSTGGRNEIHKRKKLELTKRKIGICRKKICSLSEKKWNLEGGEIGIYQGKNLWSLLKEDKGSTWLPEEEFEIYGRKTSSLLEDKMASTGRNTSRFHNTIKALVALVNIRIQSD